MRMNSLSTLFMRDSYLTVGDLEENIIQFFEKLTPVLQNEIFSEANRHSRPDHDRKVIHRVESKSNKYFDLIRILLLFHFGKEYREGIKSYLALDVTTKLDRNFELHWMKVLFEEKAYFIKWLLLSETISPHTFFGSILNIERMKDLIKKISVYFVKEIRTPVKKQQFIRGYRDKGSLKDLSSKARVEADSFPDYDVIIKLLERESTILQERQIFREILILDQDRTSSKELLIKFRILMKEEDIICLNQNQK